MFKKKLIEKFLLKSSANRQWKFESCDLSNGDDCAQRLYIFGYRQLNDKSLSQIILISSNLGIVLKLNIIIRFC